MKRTREESAAPAKAPAPRKAAPRKAAAGKPAAKKVVVKVQREDWVRAGMRILARSGVDAVLIPPLATELGVTKGSFYWHFGSRDELLLALVDAGSSTPRCA
ncbi:helix-turn-helix transcriptional regulator [Ramlibacter terrae]|uniref:Helix-turn-helix transcriptional regulator n=1 Tax=Ramlibacter terrae TaxID=2732511 RepID=A0ABX6P814_9BURK|nr:helix-turn-helix transcriptional regulator [Ramlibacter terrae]